MERSGIAAKQRMIPNINFRAFLRFLFVLCLLAVSVPVHAKNPDTIMGRWLSQQKNVGIEIYRINGTYYGRISWFKEPNYRLTDVKGMGGKPRIDRENPDPAKRSRLLMGIDLMWGFTFSGNQIWENGFVYDPVYGNTYSGKITFEPPDTIKVKGYMLHEWFGRTEILTRAYDWPQTADPVLKSVEAPPPAPPALSPVRPEHQKPAGQKTVHGKT